ncbi:hypothetical protein [Acetobacter sp.]|nr:hypothetical protein [Acetobacter sp.]
MMLTGTVALRRADALVRSSGRSGQARTRLWSLVMGDWSYG